MGSGQSGIAILIGADFRSVKFSHEMVDIISLAIEQVEKPLSTAINRPVFATDFLIVLQSIGLYDRKSIISEDTPISSRLLFARIASGGIPEKMKSGPPRKRKYEKDSRKDESLTQLPTNKNSEVLFVNS